MKKDWGKIPNFDMWASDTFQKGSDVIVIRKQFYSRSTAYWDVYLNSKKIGWAMKTKKEALSLAKNYMGKH